MPKFNDIDLADWKNSEVWTDSLWMIDERDKSGKHNNFYHGNFVPQIPRQLILRYSKTNDLIFDPFTGSGTTAYECEQLQRNFIGIELQEQLTVKIQKTLNQEHLIAKIFCGDSTQTKTINHVKDFLGTREKAQLAILHPPYADIIKFSNLEGDLSNKNTLEDFLDSFTLVVENTIKILKKSGYLALVIGDKYTKGEWIPLGFYCMQQIQKLGFSLKSTIVKNMNGNRGKRNQDGIWRYRALSSDYYIFKHEYIFIFKN